MSKLFNRIKCCVLLGKTVYVDSWNETEDGNPPFIGAVEKISSDNRLYVKHSWHAGWFPPHMVHRFKPKKIRY